MTIFARAIVAALALSAAPGLAEPPTQAREQLNAVLWLQTAAEYRAAALQTYRAAARELVSLRSDTGTASVEQARAGGFAGKPPAVVLDIDETVLDNSPYSAALVQRGQAFDPVSWEAWVLASQAQSIPGAREFVFIARRFGFRVVFITNRACRPESGFDERGRSRDCPQKAATLDNLANALGHRPAHVDLHMRFEMSGRDDSDKKARRETIARTYRIVMQVGDDLGDFIRPCEYAEERHATQWGKRWFVVPNPVYGSWERAVPDLAAKYGVLSVWDADATGADRP